MSPAERYRRVAALHAANINQGFLATLGTPFLSLLYQAIDESPESVLIVSERGGEVVGFISGGRGMSAIYRQMFRHPFRLLAAIMPSILRPQRLMRILEVVRYSGEQDVSEGLPEAELLSIAVDPRWRGKGIAEELYWTLAEYFSSIGVPAFKIVVGDALEPAHRFYRRMGAVPAGHVEVHAGKGSTLYLHSAAVKLHFSDS